MERTWTEVGAPYTDAGARPMVELAIAKLEWQETPCELPMMPGEAIKAAVKELNMPFPRRVAVSSELAPMGLYGIESKYRNGLARVYVLDVGTELTPLASDFEAVGQ